MVGAGAAAQGSFGTDSEAGSRFVERILTVVTTLRLQQRNVLDYVTKRLPGASERPVHTVPAPAGRVGRMRTRRQLIVSDRERCQTISTTLLLQILQNETAFDAF